MLDRDPVNPAAGRDHAAGAPQGGGQGHADGAAAALGHRHADPLAQQVHDQRVGAAATDLGLQIRIHPRGDQERLRLLRGEPVGDGAAAPDDQPAQLQEVPRAKPTQQPGALAQRPAHHSGAHQRDPTRWAHHQQPPHQSHSWPSATWPQPAQAPTNPPESGKI